MLGTAGARRVALHPKVFQQRDGGVFGTRAAGGSGACVLLEIRGKTRPSPTIDYLSDQGDA